MVDGANTVAYQITTTSGGANWGDYVTGSGSLVTVGLGPGGNGSTVATMYGRIASGQNKPTGTYSSSVTVRGRMPSGGSPCANLTGTALTPTVFNATVTLGGTCTITATPINFGIALGLGSARTADGALTVTCSNTMPYSIALNAGSTTGNTIASRKMSLGGTGAGVVSYQLYQDSGYSMVWGDGATGGVVYPGTGTGTAQTITVYGQVPSQSTPSAGTYQDTVTATITY
jgi:spore coat protein U-like protein